MQIVVVGMHRSGTSMVTRLINMMGAYTGIEGEVSGGAAENPEGFLERLDVRELNDEILKSADANWHRVSSFSLESVDPKQQEAFKERARAIISELDPYRPWVITDPRMCLVFPLWRELLDMPVYVFVHRRALEVAESLRARNGFPLRFGLALWEKYTIEGLRCSVGLPRIPVSYDDLLATPVKTVQNLCGLLETSGVRQLECPSAKEILSLRDEVLRHQQESPSRENQYVGVVQPQSFETLWSGATFESKSISALSEGALEALEEFEAQEQEPKREKLALEEQLLDIRLSLLEPRVSARIKMVQQLEAWFCLVRDDIQNMAASRHWKIGDAIGRAAEKVGLIPDPGVLAPERVIAKFETWQYTTKGRYDAQGTQVGSMASGASSGALDEVAQRVRAKAQIVAEKNAWLNETAPELSRLADWFQELWTGVVEMEKSGRWKVGHRLGRIAESLHLIPRMPLMPPDHARQVVSLFTQWRQDVLPYASMLDFDEDLLALQRSEGLDSWGVIDSTSQPAMADAVTPGSRSGEGAK